MATFSHAQDALAQTDVVETSTGKLKGFIDPDTEQRCFFGIPYAEPPIDELRFKAPVPKIEWQGVFMATAFGSSGPQVFDVTEGSYEEFTGLQSQNYDKPWIGSEDNLTLNIWTPAEGSKKPVMVWIHGGANWLESSRLHTYHGDNFVELGDVIFVSISYRLGVLGWMDVTSIGGEDYAGSHSNGLRDQHLALQWIKANIEAFGGDPDNITVMGESAGSIDISWVLVNGHLNGIAKRVVMMSGVAGLLGLSGDLTYGFSDEFGREEGKRFLERLDVSSIEQLQSMSTEAIMDRVSEINKNVETLFVMDSAFWPRISAFTPIDPMRGAAQNGSHGIDVMIGYTAYEMGLWLFWDDTLDQHDFNWSAERIHYAQGEETSLSYSVYKESFPDIGDGMRAMNLVGDSIFVIPTYWFADALARNGENIWMYQFDWEADDRRKALHAADQAFMFGKLDTHAAMHLLGIAKDKDDAKAREALSKVMMSAVLNYVCKGAPPAQWDRYNAETRSAMSFDFDSHMIQDPARTRRQWWYTNIYEPALG